MLKLRMQGVHMARFSKRCGQRCATPSVAAAAAAVIAVVVRMHYKQDEVVPRVC
jgi:hypothetical protein